MRNLICLFFILSILPSKFAWATMIPAAPVKRLAASFGYSFFCDQRGTLWWWGGREPNPVPVLRGAASISIGTGTVFVIKEDASLWGKGDSTSGQLGLFSKNDIEQYKKIFTNVSAVIPAYWTVYALRKDHTLWTWGEHTFRAGRRKVKNSKKPWKILDKVGQVAAGLAHTVALREDGTVWSWGSNGCGRLGTYTDIDFRNRPGKMDMDALEGRAVTWIAVADDESYAVTDDGLVWRWGQHEKKCEDISYASNAERLTFIDNVQQLAVADYSGYFLALKKDGTLWAWGYEGAFGLPAGSWDVPRKLLDNVEEMAIGNRHALALKKDGTVWSWGDNEYGQLGPGRAETDNTPRQVLIPVDGEKKQ